MQALKKLSLSATPLTFFKVVHASHYLKLPILEVDLSFCFIIWHEVDVPCGLPVGALHLTRCWNLAQW